MLSAISDIAADDDNRPGLHMHAVLGLRDGSTRSGHLVEGVVHPMLKVMLTKTPAHLHRRKSRNRALPRSIFSDGDRLRGDHHARVYSTPFQLSNDSAASVGKAP